MYAMSSSETTKLCFNSYCKDASDSWRRGWRRRTGDYAHLCDRCSSAYEEGKFCETFHLNSSGWRCCESCGKQIHCGCIVSFHMFVLLDAGGIECLSCAKRSYLLTPNPAWPPPSQFLPSQPERMKDLTVKNWSAIAGSGPVPWRQAPSLFNGSSTQSDGQMRTPFEIDAAGGIDRFRICEKLSTTSSEMNHASSYERLGNGKLTFGSLETLQNGNAGSNKELPYHYIGHSQPIFLKKESCSNMNLAEASPSKIEADDTQHSGILSQSSAFSIPVAKLVCCHNGVDSSSDVRTCHGKARGDVRGRSQLLPRYHPQISTEELQQISNESKSVITPLFEKQLSASDAGRIGRLVVPKKCAEAYFPPIAQPEGLPLKVQDMKGKEWVFQFRFWPNNNSRMYVLEGITSCIQSLQLQAGDIVTFSRLEPEGKLVMGGRKASNISSCVQVDELTIVGSDSSIPLDDRAKNKSGEVIFLNGHLKGKSLNCFQPIHQAAKADRGISLFENNEAELSAKQQETKPPVHSKKKNCFLGAKNKRLRIENEDTIELKITWKEAQGLMRPPAKIVPSVFVVEGCEFEEFEEATPVIGRPTIRGLDHSGNTIQWVQCEDCFKWRKVPGDAILPLRWICSANVWDLDRSVCSATEELRVEQLKDILPSFSKAPTKREEVIDQDDQLAALQGLDALADLAIQEEGSASAEMRSKHPRHKPGCTCIVCRQPPSGKGSKHKQSCDCVVCNSLRRRFKTLMERREKKQLEKEAESSSQNRQGPQLSDRVQDVDSYPAADAGDCNLYSEYAIIGGCHYYGNGINSASTLKGQIDLNIQPDREEELSGGSDVGSMKRAIPVTADRFLRQPRSLSSIIIENVVGKQLQQDGIGSTNFINCMAVDGSQSQN